QQRTIHVHRQYKFLKAYFTLIYAFFIHLKLPHIPKEVTEQAKVNLKKARRTAYFSILGSFGLASLKDIAGFFGNSYALIADAIESTTDIFSSFLVLIGMRFAVKPADDNHPYGHGRIEPLVTFVVVGFLFITATI